jgi:hypothetical protein
VVDDAEKALVLSRLERIHALMDEMEKAQSDHARHVLRDRVRRELEAAKIALKTLGTHDSA